VFLFVVLVFFLFRFFLFFVFFFFLFVVFGFCFVFCSFFFLHFFFFFFLFCVCFVLCFFFIVVVFVVVFFLFGGVGVVVFWVFVVPARAPLSSRRSTTPSSALISRGTVSRRFSVRVGLKSARRSPNRSRQVFCTFSAHLLRCPFGKEYPSCRFHVPTHWRHDRD